MISSERHQPGHLGELVESVESVDSVDSVDLVESVKSVESKHMPFVMPGLYLTTSQNPAVRSLIVAPPTHYFCLKCNRCILIAETHGKRNDFSKIFQKHH